MKYVAAAVVIKSLDAGMKKAMRLVWENMQY